MSRLLTPLRGVVRPGNSGGPVVDGSGGVLTTVFASTIGGSSPGGYGVANATVATVLAQAIARERAGGAGEHRAVRRGLSHGRGRAPRRRPGARVAIQRRATRYADRDVKDARDRREALRGAGPGARAEGSVPEEGGLAGGPRARDHVGGRAPRAARRARRVRPEVQDAGGWPTCRSCRSTSSSSCATSARASRCRSSPSSSARDDVDEVVNACDAGREGELIFAYLYEKAKAQQAGAAAVAELDDERGDEGGVRRRCARRRSSRCSSRPRGRARRPTGSWA